MAQILRENRISLFLNTGRGSAASKGNLYLFFFFFTDWGGGFSETRRTGGLSLTGTCGKGRSLIWDSHGQGLPR